MEEAEKEPQCTFGVREKDGRKTAPDCQLTRKNAVAQHNRFRICVPIFRFHVKSGPFHRPSSPHNRAQRTDWNIEVH